MITEKRRDLVRFIKEQIVGPGAIGYRFLDTEDSETLKNDLPKAKPLEYNNELLNSVPGAFYSSGILFPIDRSETAQSESENKLDEEDNEITDLSESDVEEEDSLSVNQMYPNTMGITFCLEPGIIGNDDDLNIVVSCRYYKKIQRKDIGSRYGLLLEQDRTLFDQLIEEFDPNTPLRTSIDLVESSSNTIVTLASLSADEIKETRQRLSEINRQFTADLGSEIPNQTLSGYKEFLYRRLKNSEHQQKAKVNLYEKIKKIEEAESFFSHIKDLIAIHDSRGYGLWKGITLKKQLKLPSVIPSDIPGRIIFSHSKHKGLRNIFFFDLRDNMQASLSANIQLSKDSKRRDKNIFVKVQIHNTSSYFTREEGDTRYYSVYNELINERMFFGLKVEVESNHLTPYRRFSVDGDQTSFNEDEVSRFIYRQYQDYAIGHGCSVEWAIDPPSLKRVYTNYIPEFDTPDVDPIPRDKYRTNGDASPKQIFDDTSFLQFKWLSTLSSTNDNEVINGLYSFVEAYSNWIDNKRTRFRDSPEVNIIDQELSQCEKDRDRMLENIKIILAGNENTGNLGSFRLMNTAMFMQLWHSVNAKKGKVKETLSTGEKSGLDHDYYKLRNDKLFGKESAAWRPFQLAFILLNLDGIYDTGQSEDWPSRNSLVDLVWFPTGGGKTEAYLGLIAITIIHRRRKYGLVGGGTAAFMRYTLRLLTLQQFQRATLLIMALELIRRWNSYNLGDEPIYIGLWVGAGSLPNKVSELEKEYQKLRDGIESNKVPFRNCPWCGSDLRASEATESNAKDTFNYHRLNLNCSNSDCSFSSPRARFRRPDHGSIPVSLSDEEIYRHPPALLFGTVDKFAQLAHKVSNESTGRDSDSRRLFGRGNWEDGKPSDGYLTPDLIIQDEMHLLLGPLGSAVALFESAIEQLCSRKINDRVIRPKVISSTATTRNTDLQIMALFDREVNLFPKPGIECDDSFFSFYKRRFVDNNIERPQYISKRKYLGFLPTGRTQIWMQMRLAAILMTHRAIFEKKYLGQKDILDPLSYDDEFTKAMDYYYSILSYFNSLREVGKTESQIQTYILKEIRRVFHRVVRPGQLMDPLHTYSIKGGELTGRLSGEEVKNELERISTSWSSQKRFAHTNENGELKSGTTPPDFIVATNMISVGIDVSRFNTILMNSMPRNIAEYIQASSRVARDKEGLVLTIHHPFRARDVSHYEKFREFHEKMYSYVEPISITPFTKKAVDRYLGLYVATLIRHTTQFHNRDSAIRIADLNDASISGLISNLTNYFRLRENRLSFSQVEDLIKNLLKPENLENIDRWVDEIISEWTEKGIEARANNRQLVFNNKVKDQDQLFIEVDEYQENFESKKWQIPQSLRVIEPEAVIKILPK